MYSTSCPRGWDLGVQSAYHTKEAFFSGLPDQDTFYDVVDCLEELGIAAVSQRHLTKKGTDLDLVEQLNIYEVRGYAF